MRKKYTKEYVEETAFLNEINSYTEDELLGNEPGWGPKTTNLAIGFIAVWLLISIGLGSLLMYLMI